MPRRPTSDLFVSRHADQGAVAAFLGSLSVVSIAYAANDALFGLLRIL